VSHLEKVNDKKWSCKYTDGSGACMEGFLASQIARALADGSLELRDGDVLELRDYACNKVNDVHKLIVTALSVASSAACEGKTAATGMETGSEAAAVKDEPAASPMKVDHQIAEVKEEAKENVPVPNAANIASPNG
jgi:uncharacterized hydantoinase/oxoprolinase family protein